VFKACNFLETFVAYPPSQKAPSFSVDQIMDDVRPKIEQTRAMQQCAGGRALRQCSLPEWSHACISAEVTHAKAARRQLARCFFGSASAASCS
jgi:hypothetical protein